MAQNNNLQSEGVRLRMRQKAALGAITLFAIILHLAMKYFFHTDVWVANVPLLTGLLVGGAILIYHLARKLFKKEFGADFLAGISIVTAILLDEYLAGMVIVLMLVGGDVLEEYALRNASSMLAALAKRMPTQAHRRQDSKLTEIHVEDICVGDVLTIFPHEICPVDGVVLDGHGRMDESYLTGEPFQMNKAPGSDVISGAINGNAALTIRATKLVKDSRYAQIANVLKTSEANKPKLRRLGDQLGSYYTPLALVVACVAWGMSGDPVRFLSVLVVATPCPLLISIPVAVLGAISLASKRGIVIKNPTVLEKIDECQTAIFDKTGTLTCGQPQLDQIICVPGINEEKILGLIASMEQYSKHPLALAVVEAAQKRSVALCEASEIHEEPGQGLRGIVDGHQLQISARNLLSHSSNLEFLPPEKAGLECVVMMDGKYAALCRFRDTPRPEGLSFIQHLSPNHGLNRIMIISGDRESEVRFLAEKMGITEIYAEKSPEEKLQLVRAETKLAKTLYVGDGINDAPALMAASVGVALGRNSDITSEAAGAVILESSLTKVDELIHIGRRMRKIALQSAIGGIVLSLIAMVFAAWGHVTPISGALIQEGIDLLSILNALRMIIPPKTLADF